MNIDANIFNKILANLIQQNSKRITYLLKWDLSQGYKDGSISANHSITYTILTN